VPTSAQRAASSYPVLPGIHDGVTPASEYSVIIAIAHEQGAIRAE
jgi:hypothetical protein